MSKNQLPYNTNLAGEFWVLSALHRLGVEALLTLGNKKSVDIVIVRSPQDMCTVDVKALAKRYDWPADNIRVFDDPAHFYVLLSFEGKIDEPLSSPSVWVVPSVQMERFKQQFKTRSVISRSRIEKDGGKYKDAWGQLTRKK